MELEAAINLADGTNGWTNLLAAIDTQGKYVTLDLSACTMSGTEFDPGAGTAGVDKIVSLILPDAATEIKAGSFGSEPFKNFTALESVTGAEVTTVGEYAFSDCTSLASVDLPKATSIGREAFSGCTSLTSVSLPEVTTIGSQAFQGTALTSVDLPAATSINSSAFAICLDLISVSLPVVTSIGSQAFRDCTGLTSVDLPTTLTTISGNPFAGCTSLTTINIDAANPNYKADSGKVLNKAGTTLIAFPSASGTVTLGTEITTIESSAFYWCTTLTSITGTNVTSIGIYAFDGCKELTTANFSAATTIGEGAFFNTGDTAVLTVTLGSTVPTLGESIFAVVTATKNVTVSVPSGVSGSYGAAPTNTTDNIWGNGFRGGGWNGSAMTGGTVNSNITLTISTY